MIPLRLVFPPKTCMNLSSPPHVSHDPSIQLFLLWTPELYLVMSTNRRSQWPRGLRRRYAATRQLRLCWNPTGKMEVFLLWALCVSGRGLCEELITRPEEYYWLWCVVVCDLDTSWMRRPWPTGGWRAKNKQQGLQITNLSNTQSFPLTSYHVSLWPKCFPQHPVVEHTQPMFLPQYKRPSLKPICNNKWIEIFCILILKFLNSKLQAKGSAPNESRVYLSTTCRLNFFMDGILIF